MREYLERECICFDSECTSLERPYSTFQKDYSTLYMKNQLMLEMSSFAVHYITTVRNGGYQSERAKISGKTGITKNDDLAICLHMALYYGTRIHLLDRTAQFKPELISFVMQSRM